MNLKKIATCALVGLVWGAGTFSASAQDRRSGTASSEWLLVPTTARTAALGSAATSGMVGMSGVEALASNPAALTLNPSTNALFSRMEYFADIGVNYFGVAQRFGANQIALSVNSWDFGDIAEQTEDAPDITPGVTYSANFISIAATYAREFTDRISAGVTVRGISESIADVSAGAVAFDAGMTYNVGASGLRFGVSLKNFGPGISYGGNGLIRGAEQGNTGGSIPVQVDAASAELPSVLNFGATYTRQFAGDVSVTGLASFRSVAYDQDQYAVGLQAGYSDLFFVRGGYEFMPDMDFTAFEGWNVGAGLNVPLGTSRIGVDYAYRSADPFTGVNMFTVGFTL